MPEHQHFAFDINKETNSEDSDKYQKKMQIYCSLEQFHLPPTSSNPGWCLNFSGLPATNGTQAAGQRGACGAAKRKCQ